MASEDSDQLGSGFASIHRLHDLGDLQQTLSSPVTITDDQFDAVRELLEVVPLGRTERVVAKERNDPFHEIRPTTNDVAVQMLSVVVWPPIDVHLPHSKELAELVETRDTAGALRHHEVVRDLVSGRVASSIRSLRLPNESNREASFSVYETDHPAALLDQPFLLVFRTRHIVTLDIVSAIIE
jgi:hypothetical protein